MSFGHNVLASFAVVVINIISRNKKILVIYKKEEKKSFPLTLAGCEVGLYTIPVRATAAELEGDPKLKYITTGDAVDSVQQVW